jgi:hypothetical protein
VFFPKLQLPSHIFEPRYREMVRDAIGHEGLIGMALLRGDWEKDYYGNPDIYSVGCPTPCEAPGMKSFTEIIFVLHSSLMDTAVQ